MPHWEAILPNATTSLLNFASVVVRSRIYLCSIEYVDAKSNASTRDWIFKIRLLDGSDRKPRLLEVTETPVDDLVVGLSNFSACSYKDAIFILERQWTHNELHINLALIFDTVTSTWSRPETSGSPRTSGFSKACQVGRAIFFNNYASGTSSNLYCLDLLTNEWRMRTVHTFDPYEELLYSQCSSWKHYLVILMSCRLRSNELPVSYKWIVSVFNTTSNVWVSPQISFTPPISCVPLCAVTYENSLIVFGKPYFGTGSPTLPIYSFDLERYTSSTVAHIYLPFSSPIFDMECLTVNNLIYCFSLSPLHYSTGLRTLTIRILSMDSKSLIMQCMTKMRRMELSMEHGTLNYGVYRLPSILNDVGRSNIPKK